MQTVVKASGLLCLFLACCLAGIQIERVFRQRYLFLCEMGEVLLYLEKEMTFHRSPLPESLRSASGGCRTQLRDLLLHTAEETDGRTGRSFAQIWELCVGESPLPDLLSEEELLTLLESGQALCAADTRMQMTLLETYRQRIASLCAASEKEWKEKGGLCRRLFAAAGVFLVILLV